MYGNPYLSYCTCEVPVTCRTFISVSVDYTLTNKAIITYDCLSYLELEIEKIFATKIHCLDLRWD